MRLPCSRCDIVSSPDPPQRGRRVWYTSRAFWGAQDVACHKIVMTTYRTIWAWQRINHSHAQQYLAMADCHMIITSKPHGTNLIGASEFRNKPKKALDVYQICRPFSLFEAGSGDETRCDSGCGQT